MKTCCFTHDCTSGCAPFKSGTELVASLKKRYPDLQLQLKENKRSIILDLLSLPRSQRKQGVGSEVMKAIIRYSDTAYKTVVLEPDSVFGTPQHVLIQFYQKFGFSPIIENTVLMMRREPTTSAK